MRHPEQYCHHLPLEIPYLLSQNHWHANSLSQKLYCALFYPRSCYHPSAVSPLTIFGLDRLRRVCLLDRMKHWWILEITPIFSKLGKVKALRERHGYPDPFRAGEGEGGEGEEWVPRSLQSRGRWRRWGRGMGTLIPSEMAKMKAVRSGNPTPVHICRYKLALSQPPSHPATEHIWDNIYLPSKTGPFLSLETRWLGYTQRGLGDSVTLREVSVTRLQ